MIKCVLISVATLSVAGSNCLAKTCTEKFAELMIGVNQDLSSEIDITTEPKNGPVQKNKFYYKKVGHWMTVMADPKQPRSLAYNNVMYTSSDEGKSWKKIRTMDSEKNNENARKDRIENAKTIRNAICGEEQLDGILVDTVEAEFNAVGSYPSQNRYKYWVNRENGWVPKAIYHTQSSNYESVTTQLSQPAPELQLPMPE